VLHPEYPIRTPRLTLRPFTMADFDDLYAIQSRPDVARYLYWEARDAAQVRAALGRKIRECALEDEGQRLDLAVVWRAVGRVVGEVTLRWLSREHRQGEIGYVFHPDYGGRGLATEAARAMLRLGFADLGLHRIIGRCDPRNEPSVGVLRRLGMRCEAHFVHSEMFKREWGDELVYAMLADEWAAGAPQASRGRATVVVERQASAGDLARGQET
jgi:RimJ/RimL family protein N-acetyltransferase